MAPEMLDTSKPKTNRVDIWSLGCVLYRMFAGCLLFKDPSEALRYAITAHAPSLALGNRGMSPTCVKFLQNVLRPTPEDRPSAEACLKGAWIVNDVLGSEHSIGEDLYTRLLKIKLGAPNMDNFSDMVAGLGANNPSVRSSSTVERPVKTRRLAYGDLKGVSIMGNLSSHQATVRSWGLKERVSLFFVFTIAFFLFHIALSLGRER